MKKIALFLSLFAHATVYAGNCSKSDDIDEFDSPIAYMDDVEPSEFDIKDSDTSSFKNPEMEEKWKNQKAYSKKLIEFLLSSKDIKIQLNAILFSNFDLDKTLAKKVLKKAISKQSDAYTLFLADNICHISSFKSWCHQQNIHDIHIQVDPENFESYKTLLSDEGENETIQEDLEFAAQNSSYSNEFSYEYTLEVAKKIAEFNQVNPEIAKGNLTFDLDAISSFIGEINLDELKRKGILSQDIENATNDTAPYVTALGINMATSDIGINYQNICSQPTNVDSCLQIADILLNSKTIMQTYYGQMVKQSANKALGIEDDSIKSKSPYEKLSCYMSSPDVIIASMLNKDLVIQYIKDSKMFDETTAAKNVAISIYSTEKKNGFNPDFNPHDCK